MRATHITHEILGQIEYYFCDFASDKDIRDFAATCPWFDADELSIVPGDVVVIKRDMSEDGGYYEKLPPRYFIEKFQALAQISNEIYHAANNFF